MFAFLKGKRGIVYLILLTILLPILVISYGYMRNIPIKGHLWNGRGDLEEKDDNKNIVNIDEVAPSVSSERRILTSVDTIISREYIYYLCNHSNIDEELIGYRDVGLDREQFSSKYSDWHIKDFNAEKITMEKMIDGYCPQHYIVRDLEGFIVVYKPDIYSNLNIIKHTDIPVKYLPQYLQEQIEEGLVVETLEEIEHIIEDMDS